MNTNITKAIVVLVLSLLGLMAVWGGCALRTRGPKSADSNFAAAFGWRGFVDTNLNFSEFFNQSHTVTARFMLQYPSAYAGPILAENGDGNYVIGMAGFDGTITKLLMNIGGRRATYAPSQGRLDAGEWHHLAVVATRGDSGLTFQFFLDGDYIGPDLVVPFNDIQLPNGTVRFGRRTDKVNVDGVEAQFYGFIDDVAVFKQALSQDDIRKYSSALRIVETDPSLYASWTFDSDVPPRPVTFGSLTKDLQPSFKLMVSDNRSNKTDAEKLPTPFQQTELQLPFPVGEAWEVIQGFGPNPGGSHNGGANFAWDFILAGKPQSDTLNKLFYAAGAGTADSLLENKGCSDPPPFNFISIKQSDDEFADYLHHVSDSSMVMVGNTVSAGMVLAKTGCSATGPNNPHLHFAVSNLGESQRGRLVTFPVAFSDYWVSTDKGASWEKVERGIPKKGEWVKR